MFKKMMYLCTCIFQNKVVDVDGTKVKLQVSDLSLIARKPVLGVSNQVRLKPTCLTKEASQSHGIANIETRYIYTI